MLDVEHLGWLRLQWEAVTRRIKYAGHKQTPVRLKHKQYFFFSNQCLLFCILIKASETEMKELAVVFYGFSTNTEILEPPIAARLDPLLGKEQDKLDEWLLDGLSSLSATSCLHS